MNAGHLAADTMRRSTSERLRMANGRDVIGWHRTGSFDSGGSAACAQDGKGISDWRLRSE